VPDNYNIDTDILRRASRLVRAHDRGVGLAHPPPIAPSPVPASIPSTIGNTSIDTHSVEDLGRRYNNCYFRAFTTGFPRIVYVRGFFGDNSDPHISADIYDEFGNRSDRYEGSFNDIIVDFEFPTLGVVNTRNYGALFISKRVERQWLRGLNSGVINISPYNGHSISLDGEIATHILRPTLITKYEAVDNLVNGKGISYGIADDIALVVSNDRSDISVYYNTDEVGHFCLMTGDIVLLQPFAPLIEYLTSKHIGVVRMGVV